jgi:6-phosphogluconate dehydrogenase
MRIVAGKDPLKKLAETFESLDLDKRIAAAKWLEGVIISQVLTVDERQSIVKASNEYTEFLTEEEYEDKVNDLIKYLRKVQKSSRG